MRFGVIAIALGAMSICAPASAQQFLSAEQIISLTADYPYSCEGWDAKSGTCTAATQTMWLTATRGTMRAVARVNEDPIVEMQIALVATMRDDSVCVKLRDGEISIASSVAIPEDQKATMISMVRQAMLIGEEVCSTIEVRGDDFWVHDFLDGEPMVDTPTRTTFLSRAPTLRME